MHLRSLRLPLFASVGVLGRVLEVGSRTFARRPSIGATLIVAGVCGTAVTLRPFARDLRHWIAERKMRAEWARERAVRASRRRIVEARLKYAPPPPLARDRRADEDHHDDQHDERRDERRDEKRDGD